MPRPPDHLHFAGADGPIGALRWAGIDGAPTVVALHGITANAWHFDPLAHHLAGSAHLVALDLRGRGSAYDHPGPFGMRAHADDVAAVLAQLGGPVTLVGHSMGCYVALMTAALHPDATGHLVLVDGGSRLTVPEGVSVDDALDTTLGPAIERLRRVWSDRVSYHTMWSQHPAFADGISIDLERNLLADLIEVDGGFRTAVNEEAVRHDGRELLADDEVRGLLDARRGPTTVIRATLGLNGAPPPLIDADAVTRAPQHRWIVADGLNHYTVLLSSEGASLVTAAVRDALIADPWH